ncbi:hypothetical protein GCM10027447_37470 [Glycomyces halotolerans]
MTGPRPHLLVETHYRPGGQAPACFAQARALRDHGVEASVLLIENGVGAAVDSPALRECLDSGAEVRVDGFSLRQRGLGPEDAHADIIVADMDWLAGYLLDRDVAVVWH